MTDIDPDPNGFECPFMHAFGIQIGQRIGTSHDQCLAIMRSENRQIRYLINMSHLVGD